MKLSDIDGFLSGKCVPADRFVNETNAEYIYRKFNSLDSALCAWKKMASRLLDGNDGVKSAELAILELRGRCHTLANDLVIAENKMQDMSQEMEKMESALKKIKSWDLPETGAYWSSGAPMKYESLYGSNGVRDYFMTLAGKTLSDIGEDDGK